MRQRPAARIFALVSILTTAAPLALADASAASYQFDFASAQGLSQALRDFGQISGQEIIFTEDLVSGRSAPKLKGTYTAEAALEQLLKGTDLIAERSSSGALMIRRIRPLTSNNAHSSNAATASSVALRRNDERRGATDLRLARAESDHGATTEADSSQARAEGSTTLEDLAEVMVTAPRNSVSVTKSGIPLIETPQSISIVNSAQIGALKAQTLGNTLRYVSDVVPETRAGFSYDILYSKGFVLDRYLDGLKVLGGIGFIAPQIDVYTLDRVEVLHGPSSTLFGSASPGGLVNMVSKRPTSEPLRRMEVQAGSYSLVQGVFDSGGPLNDDASFSYRLTMLAKDADTQVDLTHQRRYVVAPALTWRPDDATSITLFARYQHEPEAGFYSFVPAQATVRPNPLGRVPSNFFAGDPSYNLIRRTQSSIAYEAEHSFSDTFSVKQNFRYMRVRGTVNDVVPFGQLQNDRIQSRYILLDRERISAVTVDTQAQWKLDAGSVQHNVLFGLDYQHLEDRDREGQSPGPSIDVFAPVYHLPITAPALTIGLQQGLEQTGLYVQDHMKLGRWALQLGGQRSWVNAHTTNLISDARTPQSANDYTGRAGLLYRFESGLAPYASYMQSFQPVSGVDAAGRPFDPTQGAQVELGLKYQPAHTAAFITGALYELTQRNVLTADPINVGRSVQTGEVEARGATFEANAPLPAGFALIAAYTYTDAEVTRSNTASLGHRPQFVPKQAAALWLDWKPEMAPGLYLGTGVRHLSATFGDAINTIRVPSYTLVDAAMNYEFGSRTSALNGVRVSLNVSNLLDHSYIAGCSNFNCSQGLRRSIVGAVSYAW